MLSSLIFVFFLFEIFLRLFFPQDTSTPWRIYQNDGLLLNKNNGTAYHYFNKANIKAKYTFGKYHNRKYNFKKLDQKILILGDSSIFGWLLNDEDTFVYKLAKNFTDYEFINSAAGGHGISDQVRYLKKFCSKIEPSYTFYIMNFSDIDRSKKSNLYRLDENKNLIDGNNLIPPIYKFLDNFPMYDFLVSNFHVITFLKKSYVINKDYRYLNKSKKTKSNNLSEKDNTNKNIDNDYIFEKKLILELQKLSNQCKTQFYLINFAWFNKKLNQSDTYEFLERNTNFFKKNKINYINLEREMLVKYKNPKEYEIIIDEHPNAKANELYYKILNEKLRNIIN